MILVLHLYLLSWLHGTFITLITNFSLPTIVVELKVRNDNYSLSIFKSI